MAERALHGDLFQAVLPFLETATSGSFTAAANTLGVSVSAVSKAVRELEAELGVTLLLRTSRSVRLTPEGSAYLERCREAVAALRSGREELDRSRKKPTGTVRVTLSNALGPTLIPHLHRFRARYPKVQLRLNLTDRPVRLVEEQMDVALRIGTPRDSELVMRRLAEPKWVLVASPGYLAKRGGMPALKDLTRLDAVGFVGPTGQTRGVTLLRENASGIQEFDWPPALLVDNGQLLLQAAKESLGVAQVLDFMANTELKNGALVELFPQLAPPGPPVVALVPPGRLKAPSVAAVLEFLAGAFVEITRRS